MVAMRVDGTINSWINATFAKIEWAQQRRFVDWDDFKVVMIVAFEPRTKIEKARK